MSEPATQLFIIDTNVLMHDPGALFRFQEHNILLPMVVLEELDHAKKGVSEVARNVRQVSRFLDELITGADHTAIENGLPLQANRHSGDDRKPGGRLFFQTRTLPEDLPASLPGSSPDHRILGTALALQKADATRRVTLISKDINLRIKAAVTGIHAEDYHSDRVLEDATLLYAGIETLPDDFWEQHAQALESRQAHGKTCYRVTGPRITEWYPNQCLYKDGSEPFHAIVRTVTHQRAVIELPTDYSLSRNTVWGIHALNREQNFALNLLMDPQIDFVSLVGLAGSGKTLLALAAGLTQTLEDNTYREIIMTRVTVPVAEDIGFLPGTEEEKMTPWMGALMDNLEVLTHGDNSGGDWGRAATNDLLRSRIKIRSLNFMRGRTFLNRYIIVDEAQNLTPKQMKTLVTRAGPDSKIVCIGNIGQIDTPYLTETTSGLTYVVDRFREWEHSAHITLLRGERSRLADFASEQL